MGAPATSAKSKPEPLRITEQTVCLTVRVGLLGTRRRVRAEQIREVSKSEPTPSLKVKGQTDDTVVLVAADKKMLHVGKDILQSKELQAINHVGMELRAHIRARAVPQEVLRDGTYMLPLELIEKTTDRIEEFRAQFAEKVKVFVEAYPGLVASAQQRLRGAFNPQDYPPASHVAQAFYIETTWLTLEVPGSLKGVNRALYEREKKKAEKTWAEATDKIRDALRLGFAELVGTMADRLDVNADGKKKVFRNTLTEHINDFLETFEARNVVQDSDLSMLVAKAKELMKGVDVEQLRDDEALRKRVKEGFDKINTKLEPMVKGLRDISFEDEA